MCTCSVKYTVFFKTFPSRKYNIDEIKDHLSIKVQFLYTLTLSTLKRLNFK